MVSGRCKIEKALESRIWEKREKDKQIACREEEVGECPDCSFEDEIFQFAFFYDGSNGIDSVWLPCSALNVKVVSVSPCLFCSPVLSCAVPRRAVPVPVRPLVLCITVVGMSAFRSLWPSTVVSCCLLLVAVSSTFRDFKPYLFHISSRAWSLEKCLKQLREAKNMKPLWKVKAPKSWPHGKRVFQIAHNTHHTRPHTTHRHTHTHQQTHQQAHQHAHNAHNTHTTPHTAPTHGTYTSYTTHHDTSRTPHTTPQPVHIHTNTHLQHTHHTTSPDAELSC